MQVNGGVTDNSIHGFSGQKIAVNNKQDFASLKEAQDAAKDHKGSEAILRNDDGSYSIYNIAEDPKSEKQAIEMAKKGNVAEFNPNVVEFSLSGFLWDSALKIDSSKNEKGSLGEVGAEIKGSALEGSKTGKNLFNSESEAIEAAKLHTGIEAVIKTDDGKFKLYRATEQDIDKIKDNPNYKGKVTAFVVPTSITLPFMYTPITFDNVIKIPVESNNKPATTEEVTPVNNTPVQAPDADQVNTPSISMPTPGLNNNLLTNKPSLGLSLPPLAPVSLNPTSSDFSLIGDLYDPFSFDLISFPDTNLQMPTLGNTNNLPNSPSFDLGGNFSFKSPYSSLLGENSLSLGYNLYNDFDRDFSSVYETNTKENKQTIEKSVNEISQKANGFIKNESESFKNIFDNKQISIESLPDYSKSLLAKSGISGETAEGELKSALSAFKNGDNLNPRQLLLISGAAEQISKDSSISSEMKDKLNNLSSIGNELSKEVITYNEKQSSENNKLKEATAKISSKTIKTELSKNIMSIVDNSSPDKAKEDLGKMKDILSNTSTSLKEKSLLLNSLGIKSLSKLELSQELVNNTSDTVNQLLKDLNKNDNGETAKLRVKANYLGITNFDEKDNSVNLERISLKLKESRDGISEFEKSELLTFDSSIKDGVTKINESMKSIDANFKNIFTNTQITMSDMPQAVKLLLEQGGISGENAEKELSGALDAFKNGNDLTQNQLLLLSGASEKLLKNPDLDSLTKEKLTALTKTGETLMSVMGQVIDFQSTIKTEYNLLTDLGARLSPNDVNKDGVAELQAHNQELQRATFTGNSSDVANNVVKVAFSKRLLDIGLKMDYKDAVHRFNDLEATLSNNSLSIPDKVARLRSLGCEGLLGINPNDLNQNTMNTLLSDVRNRKSQFESKGSTVVDNQRKVRDKDPGFRRAMSKYQDNSDVLNQKFNSKSLIKNMETFLKAMSAMKNTINPEVQTEMFADGTEDYGDSELSVDNQKESAIKEHDEKANRLESQLSAIDNIDTSGSNIIGLLRRFREIIVNLDMDSADIKKSVSGKNKIDRKFSDLLKENRSRWNQLDEIRKEYQTHFQSSREVQGSVLPESFKNNLSNLSRDLSRNIQMFRDLNN